MTQTFLQYLWIPAVLPGQNAIIDASKTVSLIHGRNGRRKLWSRYAELKSEWTTFIVELVRQSSSLTPITRCHFWYVVAEPNRKRDPSNAAMGAIKFIEDALQSAGVIPNDGWDNVASISLNFLVARDTPGVLVVMGSERISEERAVELYHEARCQRAINLTAPPARVIRKKRKGPPVGSFPKKRSYRFGRSSR